MILMKIFAWSLWPASMICWICGFSAINDRIISGLLSNDCITGLFIMSRIVSGFCIICCAIDNGLPLNPLPHCVPAPALPPYNISINVYHKLKRIYVFSWQYYVISLEGYQIKRSLAKPNFLQKTFGYANHRSVKQYSRYDTIHLPTALFKTFINVNMTKVFLRSRLISKFLHSVLINLLFHLTGY